MPVKNFKLHRTKVNYIDTSYSKIMLQFKTLTATVLATALNQAQDKK